MVDFSTAFDTVDHMILIRKLQALNMPPNVYNLMISFLSGRVQRYKVQDTLSKAIGINLSIVQGSGIGPSLYIIMESDLHPKSRDNKLMKYRVAQKSKLLTQYNSLLFLSHPVCWRHQSLSTRDFKLHSVWRIWTYQGLGFS